jgi:hypothetical protein
VADSEAVMHKSSQNYLGPQEIFPSCKDDILAQLLCSAYFIFSQKEKDLTEEQFQKVMTVKILLQWACVLFSITSIKSDL